MDNSRQISNKIDWLDEQRRKDRKLMAELKEEFRAALDRNQGLKVGVTALEGDVAEVREFLDRVEKVDDMVEQQREEFSDRMEAAEAIRTKFERESERVRHLEREAINRSLTELGEGMQGLGQLQEDVASRKEEEYRARADINEISRSVERVARSVDENEHLISNMHERRRSDSKRTAEFSSATEAVRKRLDDLKPKIELLQDVSIRNENRISELTGLETERKLSQNAWIEQQAVTHAERERWWAELQRKSAEIEALIEGSARKLGAFGDTHRKMEQALSALDDNIAGIERRLGESAEVQRVNHERLHDEWGFFVAEGQKNRATDIMNRDELWREHDRKDKQYSARLEMLEDAEKTTGKILKHLRSMDQERLKSVFSVLRKFMSEYDEEMTKVP